MRFQVEQAVRKDGFDDVPITEEEANPQTADLGPGQERAPLQPNWSVLKISDEVNGFHLVIRDHEGVAIDAK